MRIIAWTPIGRGTLVATCSVEHPSGLVVSSVEIHRKGRTIWVSPPEVIRFISRAVRTRWVQEVLDAVQQSQGISIT